MVLCECACAKLISKVTFNLINRTDLFICLHIMFQISFQNSKGQKIITSFCVFGQNFCSVYIIQWILFHIFIKKCDPKILALLELFALVVNT